MPMRHYLVEDFFGCEDVYGGIIIILIIVIIIMRNLSKTRNKGAG